MTSDRKVEEVTLYGVQQHIEGIEGIDALVSLSEGRAKAEKECAAWNERDNDYNVIPIRRAPAGDKRESDRKVIPIRGKFPGGDRYRAVGLCCCRHQFEPSHLLDLPETLAADDAGFRPGDAYASRVEAFEEAALFNCKPMERNDDPFTWAVVIEVGQPVDYPTLTTWTLTNGIGCQQSCQYHPVRIVRPTDEEMRQYAAQPKHQNERRPETE